MPGTMPTSNASSDQLPLAFPPLSNTPIIANTTADSVIPEKETTSQHQDPSLQSALAPPLNKINLPNIDNKNNKLNLAPLGNNTMELVLRGKNSGNSAIVELEDDKHLENDIEEEIRKLILSLCNEDSNTSSNVVEQLKLIAAGTHVAHPIQEPDIKEPSAFEIVETELKKEKMTKKRASTTHRMKSKQTKLANNTSDELVQMDESNHKDEVEDYKTKEINETEKEKALDDKPDEDAQPKDEDIEKPGVNAKNDQHQFFSEMPVSLQKYVTHFFNPIGNGNCGFCCIAKALGYKDNGWLRVRNEMVEELTQNISTYYPLQGGEQAVRTIINRIKAKTLKTKITMAKWLDKLLHGHVLSNAYGRPIIFISKKESLTFFPLRFLPSHSGNHNPIYLVHSNGTHWILANLEAEDGIKPIPPPMVVPRSSHENNQAWSTFLQSGMELYNQELQA
ncbi:hypothetical protein PCANC_12506 [Puccinia coronata f. sp. avenae]|uniref:OTU domain-containing protein n=1 Tax=Puccinia coronata f. sp. avenae TaxID=200324 RepID=A0A2N5UL46_9BASI|nr:hypothetical protein PCANC_12506 [Puccinia coronata f. sp. avenae]